MEANSLLVGQNNAGKSTFIDALRLLATAISKAGTATYQLAPAWLDGEASGMGFKCNFETIDFDFRNITTNLKNDAPARLQAVFSNRARITLWLGTQTGENFAQLSTPKLGVIRTRSEACGVGLCPLIIMPPLGPLNPKESVISKGRIKEFMYGRLSSWHFRNQLYELTPEYRKWRELLEETWPGVQIKSFTGGGGESGKEFTLVVREGPFASEAAWVGSGLQAWMQILWFVCRADKDAFVVLDEPDVFLHADMQRKIAKLVLSGGFRQAAIATHSSEIISDVEPASITVIRKRERASWRPGKKAELQKVVDSLGSRHNLQLAKLAAARKVALFEGEDQKYLLETSLKINSDSYYRMSRIPSFDVQGVNNWHQAIGAARALHASSDGEIPVYLVIDRDYRSIEDIDKIRDECNKFKLNLHCWSRKEIENYIICPTVIQRIVSRKVPSISLSTIEELVIDTAESLREYTVGAIADQWQLANRKAAASEAMRQGVRIFEDMCRERPVEHVVSGKRLIRELSKRSQERWSVSFAPMTICRSTAIDEFPEEYRKLLKTLID